MKLSSAVVFSMVATSALAVPLFERRKDGVSIEYPSSGLENKRGEIVGRTGVIESREEGAIKYPMWNKEDKRTDNAHWAGTNWALEEKRTTEEYAIAHQWGHEDKRAE